MRGNHWVERATGRCVEASPASMAKRFGRPDLAFVGRDGNARSNAEWLWTPDLSAVKGVPRRFWRVSGDEVVAASDEEQRVVLAADAARREPTVEELQARIAALEAGR